MKFKLKDIADITMGQSPKGKSYNNKKDGKAFLQGRKTFGRMYPTIDTWTTEPKKIAKSGSVLMSVRAPVGDINIANDEICIGRGLCSINAKNGNNKYLYYLLLNNKANIIRKSSGTVFDSINKEQLEETILNVHKDKEQSKIVSVLNTIDEKIELNTQTNNNLFNLIKNMYFKMQEDMTEFKNIKLKDIANISSGKRPKNKGVEYNIPLIGASGIMAYTEEYNSDNDILVIGRVGTLGVVQRYFDKIWLSDNTLTIKTVYSNVLENYLKYVDYQSLNRGSTQPLITQTDISNLDIKFNEKEFNKFEDEVIKLRKKIELNNKQNKILEQLRDTLLPKLMNGEIDLIKIEV